MNIEIAKRGTGKTTRLVKAALDHLEKGEDALIFSHSHAGASLLREKFPEKYKNRVFSMTSIDTTRGRRGRRFFDEPTVLPPNFHSDDYFCLSYNCRQDIFNELLKVNNWRFTKHIKDNLFQEIQIVSCDGEPEICAELFL